MKDTFKYGQTEINYLSERDEILGSAIERIGPLEREVIPDFFEALINSIVSQQISGKAADTVWKRLVELLGEITASSIVETAEEDIQKCGMSHRKASYIKGAAAAVLNGQLDIERLRTLPDEAVIKELSALRGIGVWTAEMLLIFSLQRPDVISWLDLGIRRGMKTLYGYEELTREQFLYHSETYSPCGTVASLYLWAISSPEEG
ncbi:MAG: DNA-3-methyladenine glycosylase [Bacteroidales bacterium]|nr:DNA-3-methyladenine glycosylase [Bacteroidales bacterium]